MASQFPCPHCGNQIKEGYTVCASCGAERDFRRNGFANLLLILLGTAAMISGALALYFLAALVLGSPDPVLVPTIGLIGLTAALLFGWKMVTRVWPEEPIWVRKSAVK